VIEKYISIIRAIIVNPYDYFSKEMPEDDSVKEAMIFAVVVTTLSSAAYVAVQTPFLPAELTAVLVVALILTPLGVFAGLYVSAFFLHGVIFMICPKRKNFKQTLKILAYSSATAPLMIIPLIGAFVSAIFNIRAWIFGISAVHDVSALKIFMLFVIIPIILTMALVILIAAVFGAAILSALSDFLPSV